MAKYLFITFAAIISFGLKAQIGNKGVPAIRNYTSQMYKAGAYNWDVEINEDGKMLFANSYGLLEFDGFNWMLVLQPSNKTMIRSILKSTDGTTYLGAQNEFGYIKSFPNGQNRYRSLSSPITDDEKSFSDVWKIFETEDGIWFLTGESAFLYNENAIEIIRSDNTWRSFSQVGNTILVQDSNLDIYAIAEKQISKIIDRESINHAKVVSVLEEKSDRWVFVSESKGLYSYDIKDKSFRQLYSNPIIEENKVFEVQKLRDGYLAIGTIGGGLIILDKNYIPVQHINKQNGLQSNAVLATGTDQAGNLWVATDMGLDYVETATPLYQIDDFHQVEGAVHAIKTVGNELFVGTNVGLFSSRWNTYENPLLPQLNFEKTEGLSGQVWNLYEIAGYLYVCHQDGLFRLENDKLVKVFDATGAWCLTRLNQSADYLLGTYEGIYLLTIKNGKLFVKWKTSGFSETSRVLEIDENGDIWMAHGYKGIFRLKISPNLKSFSHVRLYTSDSGFPSSLFINLFKVKNKIIFGTENGTYQFDELSNSMKPATEFTQILGSDEHIRYLKEDPEGKIWFIKGQDMSDKVGVIDYFENNKYELTITPLQKLRGKLNPGFECIYFLENSSLLFGTKNGLIYYDQRHKRNYNKVFETAITEVKLSFNDSLIYGQPPIDQQPFFADLDRQADFSSEFNSLSFKYSSNFYEDPEKILYSTFLENHDESWSDWSTQNISEYVALTPGNYTFYVKSRNIFDNEGELDTYHFTILPPWYLTSFMKFAYILFLIVILILVIYYFRKILFKRNLYRQLNDDNHLLDREEDQLIAEKESIILQNQKLVTEIAISHSKLETLSTELASSTMMITQKNEVMIKARDQLHALIKKTKASNKKIIDGVINMISVDVEADKDWQQFKFHFDNVHGNFLERLKGEYPNLTSKDMQLAAYLRLNLSSKEIAPMMSITVRSVEGCRYRLRKHLGLSSSVNLSEFILRY
ncbi:MAG: triple tyrosine motif-containing protein [Bacteroidota bacterium]